MMREENEKKQKNIVKKAKKIRSMVMMSLLCVLMLSAATYAWFTLSNTAKVSNLTMTVGDVTGLQIAEDNGSAPAEGAWKSSIEGGTISGKLLPATTTNGIKMLEPTYDDNGAVENTTEATKYLTSASVSTDEGYWIEKTFYLRARGKAGDTTKIKLVDGTGIGNTGIWVEANKDNYNGTYVLSKNAGTSGILPGAAVRISFQKNDETTTTVFEPNSNYTTAATEIATDSRGDKSIINSTVQETMEGTCSFVSADNIFTLTNNTATKITMRIWIEGGDPQCGNEIAAQDVITQLKFVTVDSGVTP